MPVLAFLVTTALAMPGVLYLVYIALAWLLAGIGMSIRDIPGELIVGAVYVPAGVISWLATPLAAVFLAVQWGRLGVTARRFGSVLCWCSGAGAVLAFLQLTFVTMRISSH
jgi:hypothetical protein